MNKSKRFEMRLSEEEDKVLRGLEKELGLSRTDIVKKRVLEGNGLLVNTRELFLKLDHLGAELGRCGNNINQLARHANVLNKAGKLNGEIVSSFNQLFETYLKQQEELEKAFRDLIRRVKT